MNTNRIAEMIAEINTNTAADMTWQIIRSWPEYDDEATAEADPGYRSDVIVLTDGTRIEHDGTAWHVA